MLGLVLVAELKLAMGMESVELLVKALVQDLL